MPGKSPRGEPCCGWSSGTASGADGRPACGRRVPLPWTGGIASFLRGRAGGPTPVRPRAALGRGGERPSPRGPGGQLSGPGPSAMGDSDFTGLRGAEFERADMTGARFTTVNLDAATFRAGELNGVVMRGVEMINTSVDGEIRNLVVNGVDVVPLVEAELDRRHPDRRSGRPPPRGSGRPGTSTNGWGSRPSRGRADFPRNCCTNRSTARGRSSGPCVTWRSQPSHGSAAASWAIPALGTRCPGRGTG